MVFTFYFSKYLFDEDNENALFQSENLNFSQERLHKTYMTDDNKNVIIRKEEDLPFKISILTSLGKLNFSNITTYDQQDLDDKNVKKIMAWHIVSIY